MAVIGQVIIHPIMYVAVTYNHRIIDGIESVNFLIAAKQMIDNSSKLVLRNKELGEVLLGMQ